MESVNKRVILIALVMALLTSFLIYVYVKKVTTKTEVVEYINVYVAAKTLPSKHMIADADLKQVKVTREYLNPRAALNKGDIVGKRIKDSIIEGEQILKDRLVDDDKIALAFSIPTGKRAVSVNVDEQIEVANLIRPGDFVDVIASFEKEEFEDKSNKTVFPRVTKTILQNVQVLAMGQDMVVTDDKAKELPKTVTLAVGAQDVEKLVYASEYAVLRLSLRPVGDNSTIDSQGIIRGDMATGKGVLVLPK